MATDFQESVWDALKEIPEGKVATYGEIAKYLGKPQAMRAVGTAVGKNPNAPKVPCHRVVKGDGSIGQYSAGNGVPTKIKILKQEGVNVKGGKVIDFNQVIFYL